MILAASDLQPQLVLQPKKVITLSFFYGYDKQINLLNPPDS